MTDPIPSLVELEAVIGEASILARRHFGSSPHKMKANDTPVSAADTEIASLLRERLLNLVPDAAWLCEEDDQADAESALSWIVDPLDGTKEFIRHIPEIGVSIALVMDGMPELAAIANPITGETGLWSRREGLKFKSMPAPLPSPSSVTDAVANASRTEHDKGSLGIFARGMREIRPIGSVAYKLLRVAAGCESLYFSVEPKSEWDICAGVALIEAAGLQYRRFDRMPIRFGNRDSRIRSGAVAGDARLVEQFLDRFASEIERAQGEIAAGRVR